MAKNSLHIKNSQLAEAINVSGLKAKLTRKKASSAPEKLQEAQNDVLEESPPVFSTLGDHSSCASIGLHETEKETLKPVQVEPDLKEPPKSSEPEIVFSTIESSVEKASVESVTVEKLPVDPVIPVVVPEPVLQKKEESVALPISHSQETRVKSHVRPERMSVSQGTKKTYERDSRSVRPQRPFTPTPVAPRPPPPVPAVPPPFISASRNNPDQLGPVIRPPPPPPKPKPNPPAPRDRSVNGSFSERQRYPSSDRPYRPASNGGPLPSRNEGGFVRENRPYRSGGDSFSQRTSQAPRQTGDASRSFVREKPRVPKEAPSLDTKAVPVAFADGDEERASRRHELMEKKQKSPKNWDQKQKPIEIKGSRSSETQFVQHGIGDDEDGQPRWKKRRQKGLKPSFEQLEVSRPSKITVRLPISVKDLAGEMKLKAAQLISKLFLQGTTVTLNDMLVDETQVQLLGVELGCEVVIDTSEQERIRITDKTIADEIASFDESELVLRPPVVTFMGHVDHGKTSLIDAIRRSNRAASEVGAITQHIGALTCQTAHGGLTILDTPGHEAFTAMRERGASITDIVVLVIAGDEGMKAQTLEALKQAQEANATIIVALNKCDKPTFDADRVYRQMAEANLLPESWGGSVVTIPCSATTLEGINDLLEMIALQSEVLELRANPFSRARGTVIESQMAKGLGPVATVLVQNGTLKTGDCVVFGSSYARIKTMRDDFGKEILEAGPSSPVRITGLSDLPEAGEEFVAVKNEKEAKSIAESRKETLRQQSFVSSRRTSVEKMMEKASSQSAKKILNIVLRADVQGSLEAVKTALLKIQSDKVGVHIISYGVGEISESDIELAAASKATIIGFHTTVEAHAEPMIKMFSVPVRLHSIIYHAQDDVKALMKDLLDKIPEEQNRGKAQVLTLFKSSQLGVIAGCMVLEGAISRNCRIRVVRSGETIWQGAIASLKRFKEDVKEVSKGTECGIVLQGFTSFVEGDILEAFEIVYHEQDL